jgi:hypothetical protein
VITWPRWLVSVSQRGRGFHFHLFRDAADRHLQIDAKARRDLHLHVLDERNGKAALLGGDEIHTRPHREEFVIAVSAGRLDDRDAGLGIRQRDGRAGDDGAARVADRADDRAGVSNWAIALVAARPSSGAIRVARPKRRNLIRHASRVRNGGLAS